MKNYRKPLLILSGILAFFFLLLLVLPYFLQSQFVSILETELSKQVKGKLIFNKAKSGLNFIYSFPEARASLEEYYFIGEEEFKNDTLIAGKSFIVTVDYWGALLGGGIKVRRIYADSPNIHLKVNSAGKANWDISKQPKEEEKKTEKPDDGNRYRESIRSWEIKNADISLLNEQNKTELKILNLNHKANALLENDLSDLEATLQAERILLKSSGLQLSPELALDIQLKLEIDQLNRKITFKENQFLLNHFAFQLMGYLDTQDQEAMIADLKIQSLENSFQNFISLFFNNLQFNLIDSKGNFELSGYLKGTFGSKVKKVPEFNLSLKAEKGEFKFKTQSKGVSNVSLDFDLKSGKEGLPTLALKKVEALIGKDTFSASFLWSGWLEDLMLQTNLNLQELKEIFPSPLKTLDGLLEADLLIQKGKPEKTTLKIQHANFVNEEGLGLQDIQLNMFNKDQKTILENLSFVFQGGKFKAEGDYLPTGKEGGFNLNCSLENLTFEKLLAAFPQIKKENPDLERFSGSLSFTSNLQGVHSPGYDSLISIKGDAKINVNQLVVTENTSMRFLSRFVEIGLPIKVKDFIIELNLIEKLLQVNTSDIVTTDNFLARLEAAILLGDSLDAYLNAQIPAEKLNVLATGILLRMAKKSGKLDDAKRIHMDFHFFGNMDKIDYELMSIGAEAMLDKIGGNIQEIVKSLKTLSDKRLNAIKERGE